MLNALLSKDGSISRNLASVINKTSEAYKTTSTLPLQPREYSRPLKTLNEYSETNKHMNAYKELVKNNGVTVVKGLHLKVRFKSTVETAISNKGDLNVEHNQNTSPRSRSAGRIRGRLLRWTSRTHRRAGSANSCTVAQLCNCATV